MRAATVRAQAKINLILRVTGREASGYHRLATLFCRIALADIVTIRLTPNSRSVDCDGPELPARGFGTAENLAWRAAVAYAEAARWPSGFAIELEKHIPVSAGLGGGSADAGAVLRALDALNARPLGHDTLQGIARALGADVPFLTQDRSVLAAGHHRGDEWSGLAPLPERDCFLAIPSIGIPTRDAYAWIDEARGWTDRKGSSDDAKFPESFSWSDVRRYAHNDFEAVVFPRFPEIADGWRYLAYIVAQKDPTGFARMSGSGSALFAILDLGPGPSSGLPSPPSGVRTIFSRTAERVEPVQLID